MTRRAISYFTKKEFDTVDQLDLNFLDIKITAGFLKDQRHEFGKNVQLPLQFLSQGFQNQQPTFEPRR